MYEHFLIFILFIYFLIFFFCMNIFFRDSYLIFWLSQPLPQRCQFWDLESRFLGSFPGFGFWCLCYRYSDLEHLSRVLSASVSLSVKPVLKTCSGQVRALCASRPCDCMDVIHVKFPKVVPVMAPFCFNTISGCPFLHILSH